MTDDFKGYKSKSEMRRMEAQMIDMIDMIEKSAYDKLKAENDQLKEQLEKAQEGELFYQREWESACERASYVKELEADRNIAENNEAKLAVKLAELKQKLSRAVEALEMIKILNRPNSRETVLVEQALKELSGE